VRFLKTLNFVRASGTSAVLRPALWPISLVPSRWLANGKLKPRIRPLSTRSSLARGVLSMFGFGKILIQDDETAIDTTDLIDVLPDNRTPADALLGEP
jgi:hypothetical protein